MGVSFQKLLGTSLHVTVKQLSLVPLEAKGSEKLIHVEEKEDSKGVTGEERECAFVSPMNCCCHGGARSIPGLGHCSTISKLTSGIFEGTQASKQWDFGCRRQLHQSKISPMLCVPLRTGGGSSSEDSAFFLMCSLGKGVTPQGKEGRSHILATHILEHRGKSSTSFLFQCQMIAVLTLGPSTLTTSKGLVRSDWPCCCDIIEA